MREGVRACRGYGSPRAGVLTAPDEAARRPGQSRSRELALWREALFAGVLCPVLISSAHSGMSTYENVGGPPQGEWARGMFSCLETIAGIKSFAMGCCWPCCGPCLYGKISARVSWPTTKLEKLGDTSFKQWFRISVRPLPDTAVSLLAELRTCTSSLD